MAIIRRTSITVPDDDNDDEDVPIEGGVDFESINSELSDKEVTFERFMGFDLGNNGLSLHPKDVAVERLLAGTQHVQNDGQFGRMEEFYRNRIRSPLTAIRAYCVMCMGSPQAANKCTSVQCPLWTMRQGRNAFYGKREKPE